MLLISLLNLHLFATLLEKGMNLEDFLERLIIRDCSRSEHTRHNVQFSKLLKGLHCNNIVVENELRSLHAPQKSIRCLHFIYKENLKISPMIIIILFTVCEAKKLKMAKKCFLPFLISLVFTPLV